MHMCVTFCLKHLVNVLPNHQSAQQRPLSLFANTLQHTWLFEDQWRCAHGTQRRPLTVTGGAGAKPRTHPHMFSSITAPFWGSTGRSRNLRLLVARGLAAAAVVSAVWYPRHGGLCFRSSFREHHKHSERLRDDHDVTKDLARALGFPANLVERCRVGSQ